MSAITWRRSRDKIERVNWQGITVILIVSIFSIVFWMGFEQAGGTLNLFAKNHTDRVVLGYEFPASFFQSVNPFLIVALAPVFALIWSKLDSTRFGLTSIGEDGARVDPARTWVCRHVPGRQARRAVDGKVGPQWLASVFLLHHDRRDLPVSDRALAGEQAGAGPAGLADDGESGSSARRSPITWRADSNTCSKRSPPSTM